MKIEIGKFYRTRDGHVAGPAKVSDREDWPWYLDTNDDDGSAYFEDNGKCPYLPEYDLIEECENPFKNVQDTATKTFKDLVMTSAQKRILSIPMDLNAMLRDLSDDQVLAVHDLMHLLMEERHGRKNRD